MRIERTFTADEQSRLEERAHDMSQAFLWHRHAPLKEKIPAAFRKFLLVGIPILIVCGLICWAMVIFASNMETDQKIMSVGSAIVCAAITEVILFFWYFVLRDEAYKASPPVFLFFDDKLYRIDAAENFKHDQIPHIPAGELQALRHELGVITRKMTNEQIEAECYYLSAVKQYDIGNETGGLSITVIEDIVDVDVDEDNESKFIITYEDRFDEEVEMAIDMEEFSEVYEWLVEQMMRG